MLKSRVRSRCYLQRFRSLTENSRSSNHLSRPYISQKPTNVANSTTGQVSYGRPPRSIYDPWESDERNWKIRRAYGKKAKQWYGCWWVTSWPKVNWHKSEGRRKEGKVDERWKCLRETCISGCSCETRFDNLREALRRTEEAARNNLLFCWQRTIPLTSYYTACYSQVRVRKHTHVKSYSQEEQVENEIKWYRPKVKKGGYSTPRLQSIRTRMKRNSRYDIYLHIHKGTFPAEIELQWRDNLTLLHRCMSNITSGGGLRYVLRPN